MSPCPLARLGDHGVLAGGVVGHPHAHRLDTPWPSGRAGAGDHQIFRNLGTYVLMSCLAFCGEEEER